MDKMKKFLIALLFAPIMAFASGGCVHLDKWPGSVSDKAALQNGAKLFVNYCLNCHGASYMRYKTWLSFGPDRAAGQGQPDVHLRQDR
jgi:ubiquinol-cytochrome c reductase cytochrome c1 subunit